MPSNTELRNQITEKTMLHLEDMFNKEYDYEIYRTGDNLSTISFVAGEIDNKPVYGSIKFTLHKANWDLDKEISKFDDKLEEKELKAKLAAQNKAERERKAAEQKAKAEKRKAQQDLDRASTQKSIENLKAQLKDNEAE
jgi:hypothetical protein